MKGMCVAPLEWMGTRFVMREAKAVSGCMTLENLLASAERDGAEHFVVLEKANVVGVVHVAKVRELLARGASPHDLVSHVMTRERGSVVLDGGRVVGVLEAVVERTA